MTKTSRVADNNIVCVPPVVACTTSIPSNDANWHTTTVTTSVCHMFQRNERVSYLDRRRPGTIIAETKPAVFASAKHVNRPAFS
mgnify:CR=1 FL=1